MEELQEFLPKTVKVRKGAMTLISLALFVLAGLVGMYFYHYGLPPPLEEKRVEIKEFVKEKVVEVPLEPAHKKEAHSLDPREKVRLTKLQDIPYDVIFEAELAGVEAYELQDGMRYDVHLKLSNADDQYWKGRELELVVRKQPNKGVLDVTSKLMWGRVYISKPKMDSAEGRLAAPIRGGADDIQYDNRFFVKTVYVDSPERIVSLQVSGD
jgi:hypothetical protein